MLEPNPQSLGLSWQPEREVSGTGDCLFSLVIPTWNNLPYLKLCLESLERHSAFRHQVILHVNDGTDGTLDYARAHGLAFTHSPQNIGICHAVNAARGLVRARYIFYVNDDMVFLPGWDVALKEEIDALGTDAFYLSATMIEPYPTHSKPVIAAQDYGRDVAHFDEARLLQDFRGFAKADWSGATRPPSLVPTRLWDLVSGYSTELSPGLYSDPDFSAKLYAAGVRIFKGVGRARVYHFVSKSLGRITPNPGRQQFMRKWGVSAAAFQRLVLRLGEPYAGPLAPPPPGPWRLARLKAWATGLGRRI
ncbi:MAG: glycosyltransferase [Kiritimatiellae bacterium]|nr:glycosyltransferase [Kiritimatiellia bacterium]